MNKRGTTIWFTGLPCSGKSTIAVEVEKMLKARNFGVEVMDGDEVRANLSKGLGFSKEDRDTNIRRIGYVCKLLSRNGAIAISAAISPYQSVRREVREMIANDANFVEVFVDAPADVCERRDVKGMWALARSGEIKGFTGIDDPYEVPEKAEIICETHNETVEESARIVVRAMEAMNLIEADGKLEISADEEAKIQARLKTLGFLS